MFFPYIYIVTQMGEIFSTTLDLSVLWRRSGSSPATSRPGCWSHCPWLLPSPFERLAQLLLGSLAGYNCLCGAVDRSLRCPPSVSPPARLDIFLFSPQRTFTIFYNFFAEMLNFCPKIVIFSINSEISSTNMRSALLLFRTLLANNAPARLSWYSSNQCNQYLCNHNHHVCTLNPTELTIRNQDRIFRSWKPVRIFMPFF